MSDAISVISACGQNTDPLPASTFCSAVRKNAKNVLYKAVSVLVLARQILLPRYDLIISVAVADMIYRVVNYKPDNHANMDKQLLVQAGKVLRDSFVFSVAFHIFAQCVVLMLGVIGRACGISWEPRESSSVHPGAR